MYIVQQRNAHSNLVILVNEFYAILRTKNIN